VSERESLGERLAAARQEWLKDNPLIGVHDDDGRGYLYAKDELLVPGHDLERLTRALGQLQIPFEHDGEDDLGVARVRLAFKQDDLERPKVPDVLAQLRDFLQKERERLPESAPLHVGPNHVLCGEPEYDGGPATAAIPTDQQVAMRGQLGRQLLGQPGGRLGKGVHVAVIDTGYTRGVHPVMDSRVASTGTPELDAEPKDGLIDFEAGHGTFVSGIILHRAPRASVSVTEVLGSAGFGTEHDIAHAILTHTDANVINLSLAGYTDGDQPPVAIDAALRKVRSGTAVVAAAGNNSSSRPMWPAAFKRVVSVGAVDKDQRRAAFSNYGWWVDACTGGVDIVGAFPVFSPEQEADASEPFFDGWAIWSGTSFAAPKLSGEIAARVSTGHYANARLAAASLVDDPTRPHLPGLGTLLFL
jgi:hypothetical protein